MDSLRSLGGDCPSYNGNVCWVSDPFEGKLYMVQGTRPGEDTDLIPTSDFYSIDTTTYDCKNLTKALKFRDPRSPFSMGGHKLSEKELPERASADCTSMRIDDASFLLMFGGHDIETDKASSKLIVVDLGCLEWWYQAVEGGPVVGRIDPSLVAINQQLFIFGGYRHFDGDGGPHSSYSIAGLSDGRWTWQASDVPYPRNVPRGSIFDGCPVDGGRKILLTPWRTTHRGKNLKDYLIFTENNIFYFDIQRREFHRVNITGDIPKNIEWYYTFFLDKSTLEPKRIPDKRSPSPPGPPIWPAASASTSASSSSSESSSSSSFSALICGWHQAENWGYPAPELWRLEVVPPPKRSTIQKLGIARLVRELESGFEGAAWVRDRLCLLGSSLDSDKQKTDAALNPDAKYDRYLEISLHPRYVV